MRLEGKVAVVTGGASGIGRATADIFAREGAVVYATDIANPEPGFADANTHFFKHDVSSESDWARVVSQVVEQQGCIDILVNNAGIGGTMAPVDEEDLPSWNLVLAVNITGPFLGMRAVIPHMRKQKSGSIINVSSIWGNAAVEYGAAYQATKGAVRQLTKHAAVACGADNIRVNSIHPGVIVTPPVSRFIQEDSARVAAVVDASALGRMATPDELARSILFLADDDSAFMTGAELVVDGGYLAKGN